MSARVGAPLVVVAAGGTGGHLFPAEALATALQQRGIIVDLATDRRATHYGHAFPARMTHVIPSATFKERNPLAAAKTAATLLTGMAKAFAMLGTMRPAAVVGFGGYPSIPPVLAASLRGIRTVLHEQNAVMGRANRFLSRRADVIATSFPGVLDAASGLSEKASFTGNPVRPAVLRAATIGYESPQAGGKLKLLVFGGSQGARVMSEVVPSAIRRLDEALRGRLAIVQQAREEDLASVRETYARLGVAAEVAPFFSDLPARIAQAHLVVSRAGASTIAELAAIGRPAILVPLPHSLDQDQLANGRALQTAGGALVLTQDAFSPERLASELTTFASAPERLAQMAARARSLGVLDAAERLADLVLRVARVDQPLRPQPNKLTLSAFSVMAEQAACVGAAACRRVWSGAGQPKIMDWTRA